jgi:hypothetical protein
MSYMTDQKWVAFTVNGKAWHVGAVNTASKTYDRIVCADLTEADAKLIAAAPQLAALLARRYCATNGTDAWVKANEDRVEAVMADIGGPSAWHGRAL